MDQLIKYINVIMTIGFINSVSTFVFAGFLVYEGVIVTLNTDAASYCWLIWANTLFNYIGNIIMISLMFYLELANPYSNKDSHIKKTLILYSLFGVYSSWTLYINYNISDECVEKYQRNNFDTLLDSLTYETRLFFLKISILIFAILLMCVRIRQAPTLPT